MGTVTWHLFSSFAAVECSSPASITANTPSNTRRTGPKWRYTYTYTHTQQYAHTHEHTCTPTYTHTHTCARTHIHTHTHTNPNVNTKTHKHVHAHAHKHIHTQTGTHRDTHTHINAHTHSQCLTKMQYFLILQYSRYWILDLSLSHAHTRTHLHTHAPTHTQCVCACGSHAYTHTHTCTHTHNEYLNMIQYALTLKYALLTLFNDGTNMKNVTMESLSGRTVGHNDMDWGLMDEMALVSLLTDPTTKALFVGDPDSPECRALLIKKFGSKFSPEQCQKKVSMYTHVYMYTSMYLYKYTCLHCSDLLQKLLLAYFTPLKPWALQ